MPTPVAPSPSYVGALGEQTTLPAIIDLRAEATPDHCFATLGGRSLTFAQALQRAESAAGALASLGVRKGDKVAIMLPNSLEFIDLWFGSALLGAVIVPVNTQLRGEGLRYIVDHCDADVCVVDAQLVEQYEFAVPAGAGPSQRFVRGREAPTSWTPVEDLLSGDHSPAPRAKVEPEDLASVLYTSGTTGLPKGVMTCHNAYAATGFEYAQRYVRLRADDVLYTCLPLFHSNAQAITTVPALLSGRPMVMTSRFSASGFLDEMRSHGATVFNYIGAMLTILLKQPERPDDADNPIRLTVGSSAPREAVDRVRAPVRHTDRRDLRADGDGGRLPRQPARRRARGEMRRSGELVGGPDPQRRGHRGRPGRAGRVRHPQPAAQRDVPRLLQGPRRDGEGDGAVAGSIRATAAGARRTDTSSSSTA